MTMTPAQDFMAEGSDDQAQAVEQVSDAQAPDTWWQVIWQSKLARAGIIIVGLYLLAKVLKKGEKLADSGSLLVGDKGVLFSPNDYGAKFRLLPERDFAGVQTDRPEKAAEGTDRDQDVHMKKEWAEAIRAGKPELASSNFDYAGQLTETTIAPRRTSMRISCAEVTDCTDSIGSATKSSTR